MCMYVYAVNMNIPAVQTDVQKTATNVLVRYQGTATFF